MLLKILGTGLALFAALLLGQYYSGRMKRRGKELSEVISVLHLIESEIRYKLSQKDEILRKIAGSAPPAIAALFLGRDCRSELSLSSEDYAVLDEFLQTFGTLDFDSQLARLAFCRERLKERMGEAQEEYQKYSRLIRCLSPLLVLALCLLFF